MIGRTNTGGGKGGGGGALNFRVLSGLTEPISPKKNDIWVYSDVDVTAYAFSGSEPSIRTLNCSVETASSHIGADGTIVSKVAYGITGYLELPENSKTIIVTSCDVNSTDVYHEFYDKNKSSISRVPRSNGVTTYDVPANAAYVRLSRYIVTANSDSDSATVTIDDGITKEGAVWISTGTSSPVEFNALKKNGITVYPISAKQYVSGAWVSVTAQSYQDGAWCEWLPEGALYWRGNECADVTGGWTSKAWKMQSDAGTLAQTFTIARNADHLMFTKTGEVGAVMYATNPIDLTNVKAIHFKGEMSPTARNNWVAFHVWTKMGGNYWASNSVATVQSTGTGKTEFSLDVSNLSGNHYLGFGIYSSMHYVKLEELILEVE